MLEQKIKTFFMFSGQAEEAMNFYISLFDGSEVLHIQRYGPNEDGADESVKKASFSLGGQQFMCIDSNIRHDFTFTPSMSLYVECKSEEEIDHLFEKLSEGGTVHMPLASYPFSDKFGWVGDRFGVSWQLDLAGK